MTSGRADCVLPGFHIRGNDVEKNGGCCATAVGSQAGNSLAQSDGAVEAGVAIVGVDVTIVEGHEERVAGIPVVIDPILITADDPP